LTRMSLLSPLLLLLCTQLTVAAPSADPQPLTAFRALYSAQTDLDMSSAEASRELKPLADGQWEFNVKASALLVTQRERSRFHFANGGIRPDSYRYLRELFGHQRRVDLTFDWRRQRVTTTVDEQPWQMPLALQTQDKLSYQLQMRLDLKRGLRQFSYPVADGGLLKTYRFEVIGQEHITTPYGEFDTLKVVRVRDGDEERVTHIWFAPALDFMVVRIYQSEADGKEYGLLLKQLERL